MSGIQEKFQTILPTAPGDDDGNEWVGFKSARNTGSVGQTHRNNQTAAEETDGKLNLTPPGSDINNQARREINNMPFSMAGATDVSGGCNFKDNSIYKKGFCRQEMRGCDDQYTAEHVDHFYGAVVDHDGDGEVYEGFAERNNYLDRI